jgi:hypothetical protein
MVFSLYKINTLISWIFISGHLTETSGHLTETSGHLTETSDHLTETSGHLTETSGHLTETSGHLTETSGHLTETLGHLTEKSGHLTETSGHLTETTIRGLTCYSTRTYYLDSEPTSLRSKCCVLSGEATQRNSIVFGLTRPGLEPMIYHNKGEHAYHYITVFFL